MGYLDKAEQREYQRRWIANRRAAFFSDKECVSCASVENLQLHHIDPSTKVSHNIWSWSEDRRFEEVLKCEVKCSRCHMGDHGLARQVHGLNRYDRGGCRCSVCKEAKRIKNKRYREKTVKNNIAPVV